jgi:hypothetical protein
MSLFTIIHIDINDNSFDINSDESLKKDKYESKETSKDKSSIKDLVFPG